LKNEIQKKKFIYIVTKNQAYKIIFQW